MSMWLPALPYSDGIRKRTNVTFGGYEHTAGASNGKIYDMTNLCSNAYPIISTRKKRYNYETLTDPLAGVFALDALYYCCDDSDGLPTLYGNGIAVCAANTAGDKSVAVLGDKTVIFPDKLYAVMGEWGTGKDMTSTWLGWNLAVSFRDGVLYGEAAVGNTIYCSGTDLSEYFRVGDAVRIQGAGAVGVDGDATYIVRELYLGSNGIGLSFYENTFDLGDNTDRILTGITISRPVPDMDFVFECDNRLWGCKGSTIYASKLGDPLNFNVFDGLSTDSWTADVGSAGDFTAALAFAGYPTFFKEDRIYRVYGDEPSAFRYVESAYLGVEAGSRLSPAVVGETLYYKSRAGIMAWRGGVPVDISAAFGDVRYKNAVGGSDGSKYYVSMADLDGGWHLFVYDPRRALWHREDDTHALGFGYYKNLYMLCSGGAMMCITSPPETDGTGAENFTLEDDFPSVCEFGDFDEGDPNRKGIAKLQLRLGLDVGASVTVYARYGTGGDWETVRTLTNAGSAVSKDGYYLPIIPRRADHVRLKLAGTGGWRLYSITREVYSGSELF